MPVHPCTVSGVLTCPRAEPQQHPPTPSTQSPHTPPAPASLPTPWPFPSPLNQS